MSSEKLLALIDHQFIRNSKDGLKFMIKNFMTNDKATKAMMIGFIKLIRTSEFFMELFYELKALEVIDF